MKPLNRFGVLLPALDRHESLRSYCERFANSFDELGAVVLVSSPESTPHRGFVRIRDYAKREHIVTGRWQEVFIKLQNFDPERHAGRTLAYWGRVRPRLAKREHGSFLWLNADPSANINIAITGDHAVQRFFSVHKVRMDELYRADVLVIGECSKLKNGKFAVYCKEVEYTAVRTRPA